MAEYLAFDWERTRLVGVEASVSPGRVNVLRVLSLEWPANAQPEENPEGAGAWLAEELRRAGVSAKEVLVAVPREDVVVRRVELPAVDDAELPDLVRYQAASKSSTPLDQLHLDYLPLPIVSEAEGRDALFVTMPKSGVQRIAAILKKCDRQLVGISPGTTAVMELLLRGEPRGSGESTELIVSKHGERAEFSISRGKFVHLVHSTRLTGQSDAQNNQMVLAEISRSLVALQRRIHDIRPEQVWVIGSAGEHDDLKNALADRLRCPVQMLDASKIRGLEVRSESLKGQQGLLAGPMGMLLGRSGAMSDAIDFLAPRKAAEKVDPRKRQLKMAAIAAGVGALLAVAWGGSRVYRLSKEIGEMETTTGRLQGVWNKAQPELTAFSKIERWRNGTPDWLGELNTFAANLPGTEMVYVKKLDLINAQDQQGTSGVNTRRAAPRGKILADVVGKSRLELENLQATLEDVEGLRVESSPVDSGTDDSAYPTKTQLKVNVVDPQQEAASKAVAAKNGK